MTHRGSCAEFCREDIDVPRLLASSHVHIGECVSILYTESLSCVLRVCSPVTKNVCVTRIQSQIFRKIGHLFKAQEPQATRVLWPRSHRRGKVSAKHVTVRICRHLHRGKSVHTSLGKYVVFSFSSAKLAPPLRQTNVKPFLVRFSPPSEQSGGECFSRRMTTFCLALFSDAFKSPSTPAFQHPSAFCPPPPPRPPTFSLPRFPRQFRTAGFYNCPALAKDLPRLLTEARANGATCSLGPQWDASEEWGGLDDVYPLLDVFMPNEVFDLSA